MYQALYRKYRSQTFEDMVGQEVVSKTLRQAVEQDKISHAYLFSGPRGTGKTSAAKIFAKAMNCPNQKDGEPCNDCYICQAITEGSLEDVIEIDAASNNGVDEIRDIRDKSTYAPSIAKHKVYIIDEVHMLSIGAFNALLKTLEEPTENVVFILATTELHKIPATILSRVQRFEFKSIQTPAIEAHLARVLDQEGIGYDQEALALIARRAEGGMRDALSILDQAISLSDDQGVGLAIAEEITGSISLGALDSYVAAVLAGDGTSALDQLQLIFDSGKSMTRFVTDLLQYLRDLLVSQVSGEKESQTEIFQANLAAPQDQLFSMIEKATDALPTIKGSQQPKIYAEMLTLQLAESSSAGQLPANIMKEFNALKQEIAQLKKALANVGSVAPAKAKTSAAPAKTNRKDYVADKNKVNAILEEAVENPDRSRENLIRLQNAWGEVIESLTGADRALMVDSEPVAANERHAILSFESNFNAGQTMKRDNLNTMFGNILSQAAGFSPEILAISKEEWKRYRAEFAAKRKGGGAAEEEKKEEVIPQAFEFLADQVIVQED